MKLLLISVKRDLAVGGIAVWTEYFLQLCHEKKVDCNLVNTEVLGSRAKTGKRNFRDEWTRTLRIFREVKRQLKEKKFDAVYLNTSCGRFGLIRDWWLARGIARKKIPLITQYHCDIPYWVRKEFSRRILGKLARISCVNLVLCQNSKNFLMEEYGIDSVKLPNFVSSEFVLSSPKKIGEQVKTVSYLGRVSEKKGAKELFEVARRLPEIRFLFAGRESGAMKEAPLPENVSLLGEIPHSQVGEFLDRADLFLFPSHTEGCSMALMESMARGVPAIATDVGANADLLGGGCGVIVAKHDVDAMVEAIGFLQNPHFRRETSRNAVEKVRERYTEENVEKILILIRDCLKSKVETF